jgi:hypothetical protein
MTVGSLSDPRDGFVHERAPEEGGYIEIRIRGPGGDMARFAEKRSGSGLQASGGSPAACERTYLLGEGPGLSSS